MRLLICITAITLFSCTKPTNSISNKDIEFKAYVDTYGEALDVGITEQSLIVAANYQGYIVYDINRNNQGDIIAIDSIFNAIDMASDMGDNRAQDITVSQNHELAFITDRYDRIWLYKLNETADQYVDNYLQDCYGGTWLSTAIDDREDHINVFSLVQHVSSEDEEGGSVGDFDAYSTSIVWKRLTNVNSTDILPELDSSPSCEFTYNFNILPRTIDFNNGILAISYGELGVKILKQTENSICLDDDNVMLDNFIPTGDIAADKTICEQEYDENYNPGLSGNYEPFGGFYPYVYSSFDLPGEVDALLVRDSIIFAGLTTSNGCYMSLLGTNGVISDKLSFAQGYSINNLSEDNNILALSAGHDGVLVYKRDGISLNYIGQISTPYSNNVKVDGNNVIISTEDGLYIYLIK